MKITDFITFIYLNKKSIDKKAIELCKELKITGSSISLLFFLYNYPNLNTSKDICANGNLKRANVSVLVEFLTLRGFITQKEDKEDRRSKKLFLTEKSKELIVKVNKIIDEQKAVCFDGLSEEEVRTLDGIFEKMYSNIRKTKNI